MFLAAEPNPNLVYVIAAIPATLVAIANFVAIIRNRRENEAQHLQTATEVAATKQLLLTHAARMGTIERRTENIIPQLPDGTPIPGPAPSKKTGKR